MSCILMSKHELLAIASIIAKKRKVNHYHELFSIASELLKINTQSVNSRYNEKTRFSNVKFYDFECNPYDFDAINEAQKAKLIDCFIYQITCKKGYRTLPIIIELQALRDLMQYDESDYDCSEWGLSEDNTPKKQRGYYASYETIQGYSKKLVNK